MANIKVYFSLLFATFLLIQFSIYALLSTNNSWYWMGIIFSSFAITYIIYILYSKLTYQIKPKKEYSFYITDDNNNDEDVLFKNLRKRY
ncbi:hypothetical protein SYNTR_0689 [Candidatus Syntrophocurvum alkaliphilum]|uniref:Uncharacterized protein n=1 Tax=Candidatus Syntrophocurvum alkaliphilum TaxID=2293317 RepID=A0A6I6DE14_9FIRM|nr:hypothetical protein [Candidatus Syntrophocurvum alkaliphilum]QGT99282.1 hypothetical protein SYNTR_0689 [Candidatus Syntrophocurvum alkaliphilum]